MMPQFSFDKRGAPYKKYQEPTNQWRSQRKTYIPFVVVPFGKWIQPIVRPNSNKQKWRVVKVCDGSSYHDNSQVSKNYSYGSRKYLGKKFVTRT